MEDKDISTHSLRHTFATRCIEAGMSAVVLQRLIGHTDISITLNTYTSVFNRFKESELEKVMEYYKTNSLGLEPIKNEEIVENKEVEIEDDMEMYIAYLLLSKFRLCNTKTYLLFLCQKVFMGNSSPYPL